MPKKNITPLDAARQQIKAILAERKRAEAKARKLRAKNKQKAELREIAIRARALKKLGLYNPKNPIKQSSITRAQTRRVNTLFKTLMRHGKYIERGKTVRPLNKVAKVAKTGKIIETYQLNENFAFLRTKKKTKIKQGVIKTSKGYIVEKDSPSSKVRINNNGDITQSTKNEKGPRTLTRRKAITGNAIAKFVDDVENNKVRIKENQHLMYRRFGWVDSSNVKLFDHDEMDLFAQLFRDYQKEMPPAIFKGWMDASELLIRDN